MISDEIKVLLQKYVPPLTNLDVEILSKELDAIFRKELRKQKKAGKSKIA